MKLSYIIPVYNVEKYILNCLYSVYAQNLNENDFEVICVDDGSPDRSAEIIRDFQKEHSNLKLYQSESGGVSAARNRGIICASGDYIFFVDSDDYLAQNSVGGVLRSAYQYNADIICFDCKDVKDELATKCEYDESEKDYPVLNGKEYFSQYNPLNAVWAFLIKRSFCKEHSLSFIQGRFCEDGMFSISCWNYAERVVYCHTDVYRYVAREGSIVHSNNPIHLRKVIEDFQYAIMYIDSYIEKEKDGNEEFRKKLIARRDTYTFFLLIRILKAGLSADERSTILKKLEENDCYPFAPLSKNYGSLIVFLSSAFQQKWLFNLSCNLYRFIPINYR